MFLKKLGCRVHGYHTDAGILLLRLAVALPFVYAGWFKLNNLEMANGMMAGIGLPNGSGLVIGLIELLGGIALILGTHVQVAGILLAAIMVGAIAFVKGKMGYAQGYQLDLILLLGALALVKFGAGEWSLDAKKGACSCADDGCCGGGACGEQEECCGSGACGEACETEEMMAMCDDNGVCAVVTPEKEGACCDHEHKA